LTPLHLVISSFFLFTLLLATSRDSSLMSPLTSPRSSFSPFCCFDLRRCFAFDCRAPVCYFFPPLPRDAMFFSFTVTSAKSLPSVQGFFTLLRAHSQPTPHPIFFSPPPCFFFSPPVGSRSVPLPFTDHHSSKSCLSPLNHLWLQGLLSPTSSTRIFFVTVSLESLDGHSPRPQNRPRLPFFTFTSHVNASHVCFSHCFFFCFCPHLFSHPPGIFDKDFVVHKTPGTLLDPTPTCLVFPEDALPPSLLSNRGTMVTVFITAHFFFFPPFLFAPPPPPPHPVSLKEEDETATKSVGESVIRLFPFLPPRYGCPVTPPPPPTPHCSLFPFFSFRGKRFEFKRKEILRFLESFFLCPPRGT